MKKLLALTAALALSAVCLIIPAAAESKTFVDTLEDNYPLVFEKSENMRFEKNKDVDKTFYEKYSDKGDVATEEYVTYKLNGDITGFTIDCMHVNGLGKAETDIAVFLSKDNKSWTEASVKVSAQTFDDEIYINEETAYWKMSTVSNDGACPTGSRYIKIVILPFTVKDSCVWNTVLDTVSVQYTAAASAQTTKAPAPTAGQTTAAPDKTTAGTATDASQATEDTTAASTETAQTAGTTTAAPLSSQPEQGGGGSALPFIIGGAAVVLAGAGVAVYIYLKKKKAVQ